MRRAVAVFALLVDEAAHLIDGLGQPARRAVQALEKHFDPEEGEGWAVRLHGVDELLSVSRRQLATLRGLIAG